MKTLEQVRNFLSSIEAIDVGGCGIATLALYRFLKKNNIFVKMCFGYTNDHTKYFIHNTLVGIYNHDNIIPPSHAFIFDGQNYIDCDNQMLPDDIKEYMPNIQNVSEQYMVQCINTPYWNPFFDRNNIKLIEKELEIDLSDIIINLPIKNRVMMKKQVTI
jgi:hypothetical protein